jgi:hypothetical protein
MKGTMKFDTTRVTQSIDWLREVSGPEVSARLGAFVAERWQQLGWETESSLLCWSRWRWTALGPRRRRGSSPLIIARPRESPPAPVRVIFAAPFCFDRQSMDDADKTQRIGTRDLAGVAFLIELARSWPKSRLLRIEAVLMAAAGPSPVVPGTQEVLRRVQTEWPPKPTLLIVIYGPGVGRELVVDAFPLRRLVLEAARGLWVPIRLLSRNPFSSHRMRWPFRNPFPDHVTLAGADSFCSPASDLDAPAAGRAEQLASEIALRWAAVHADQARAAFKSSQYSG